MTENQVRILGHLHFTRCCWHRTPAPDPNTNPGLSLKIPPTPPTPLTPSTHLPTDRVTVGGVGGSNDRATDH